jgi:hypothetical protein
LRQLNVADPLVANPEIKLPLRIAGVGVCQTFGNGEAVVIGFQRAGKVALRHLHVADPLVGHRQIALPARVARAGFRQPVGNGEAVIIGFQRAGKVAFGTLHVADLVERHRQIALPAPAGVGFRQPVSDREAVAIGFQRAGKVSLGHLHVADPVVGHREIALPLRIAGIGIRQSLGDGEAVVVGFQRAGKVAPLFLDFAEADERPTLVMRLIASICERQHALKPRLRFVEIAVIDVNPACPIQAVQIVRIEFGGLLVSLQRPLRVGEASNRAEVAIGNRRFLPVLFGKRGFLPGPR